MWCLGLCRTHDQARGPTHHGLPLGHKCSHARSGCRAGLEQCMFLCVSVAPWEIGGTGPGPPHFTTPTARKAEGLVPRQHLQVQLVEPKGGRAQRGGSSNQQPHYAPTASGQQKTPSLVWLSSERALAPRAPTHLSPCQKGRSEDWPCCRRNT